MKEVTVVTSCDKCKGKSNVEEYTVRNSKGKEVILDLDKSCFEEVYGPGLVLADDRGVMPGKAPKVVSPDSKKPKADSRICLVCPETRASDGGILNHMKTEHGFPASIPEVFGNRCPLDGEEYPPGSHHISQHHKDLTHISQAFARAKANGDPYGVVAARIDALEKLPEATG
jgi:hypothetical protein